MYRESDEIRNMKKAIVTPITANFTANSAFEENDNVLARIVPVKTINPTIHLFLKECTYFV